ncbi:MAG: hypothetical protein RL755_2198 [Pseudomonadota bacterium]
MGYLIDTNILSELRKDKKANAGVRDWYAQIDGNSLYVSVLTLGEIRQGIESLRRRDVIAAESLHSWLKKLEIGKVLAITPEIADCWGRINVPDKLPVIDGYLAATALVHNLTLVTRNVKDVERSGVKLLNPFN